MEEGFSFIDKRKLELYPGIRKEFEEYLMARSEFWQNSWNFILDKDYLTKE